MHQPTYLSVDTGLKRMFDLMSKIAFEIAPHIPIHGSPGTPVGPGVRLNDAAPRHELLTACFKAMISLIDILEQGCIQREMLGRAAYTAALQEAYSRVDDVPFAAHTFWFGLAGAAARRERAASGQWPDEDQT